MRTGGGFSRGVSSAPVVTAPTLVQHRASTSNPVGLGAETGNNFAFTVQTPVGAGNCLVLAITDPSGKTVTSITDSVNGTWPAATVTATNSGGFTAAIFVLPNAGAGATTITVNFNASCTQFQYTVSEFCNVALTSPVNNHSSNAAVSAPNLSCGSFTPTVDGSLVYAYYGLAANPSANPTSFVPTNSFSLLHGDIGWKGGNGVPTASAYIVQSTATAVNPGITATADSGNIYNGIAISLTPASAGTAPLSTVNIVRLSDFTGSSITTTWKLQIPSSGNMRLLTTSFDQDLWDVTSVVDSEGITWTNYIPTNNCAMMFYRTGTSANNALTVTITINAAGEYPTPSIRYFDIANSAGIDVLAFQASVSVGSGVTTLAHQPDITPTVSGDLVIATLSIFTGPGLSVTSPSGAIWDMVNYTGKDSNELMNNSDGGAHLYNATTSAENWSYTCASQSSNFFWSCAVAIKSL